MPHRSCGQTTPGRTPPSFTPGFPAIAVGTAASLVVAQAVANNGEDIAGALEHDPNPIEYTPSALFSQSLKVVDDSSDVDIVVQYNHTLLESKCKRSSKEYDASLDLDLIVKEIFRPDEWWESRELLRISLIQFGSMSGFQPIIAKNTIKCSREGAKEYKRHYAVRSEARSDE